MKDNLGAMDVKSNLTPPQSLKRNKEVRVNKGHARENGHNECKRHLPALTDLKDMEKPI